jgi:hypothetical protein
MVSTVVFNGHVDTVDPATGRKIRPSLISMRATREKFDELVRTEPRFDPVASIKRHFFAAISPHPEELKAVEPVMPFSRADPRVIEAIDVISGLDQRPNLLDLTPKEFESFIQNLFTKMGYETDQYRSSGDGGIEAEFSSVLFHLGLGLRVRVIFVRGYSVGAGCLFALSCAAIAERLDTAYPADMSNARLHQPPCLAGYFHQRAHQHGGRYGGELSAHQLHNRPCVL